MNTKMPLSVFTDMFILFSLPFLQLFFLIDPGSLGWATWRNRWSEYEKDGRKLFQQIKAKKLEKEFNYDNTYPFIKMLRHQIQGKKQLLGNQVVRPCVIATAINALS